MSSLDSAPTTVPASGHSRLRLIVVSGVIFFLTTLTVYTVWDSYQERQALISSVERQTQSYARALKEHAERTFSEVDLVLKNAVTDINHSRDPEKISQAALEQLVRHHAVNAPQIGSISYVDSSGQMKATSLPTPDSLPSLAERPLYRFHRDNSSDQLFINPPFKSRLTGKWRFTLSRRVSTSSGRFAGIVLAAIEISYFEKLYLSVVANNNGRFSLATTSGDYLVLVPSSEDVYSSGKKTAAFFRQRVQANPADTYHNPRSNIAKEYRIVSYNRLDRFPVVAIMSLGRDKALEEWHLANLNRTVTISLLGLVIIILSRMLLRQVNLLDRKVLERTSLLSLANSFLEKEIEERKQIEAHLLEQQHKLGRMAEELSLAEDRERGRIAGELHDQVCQRLILAKIKLDQLMCEAGSPETVKTVSEAEELLEQSVHDIRTLTFQMRPPLLATAGLFSALRWLGDELQRDYGLEIKFDIYEHEGSQELLRFEISNSLFQIIRELLLNVIKHAGVGTAWLSLQLTKDHLQVRITDNGNGFDLQQITSRISAKGGFGLYNIQQKMGYLGGSCLFDTSPGMGTCVTLALPLKPELLKEHADGAEDTAG